MAQLQILEKSLVIMEKIERDIRFDKNTNLAEEKKRLRQEILAIRNSMPLLLRQQKSNKILQTVYDIETYKDAEVILTYVDYQSEVMTSPLIKRALLEGKKVYCPKVSGNDMDFYRISSLNDLKEGYKGIREPDIVELFIGMQKNQSDKKIFVIMPGVAFDKDCHRIGYGKGFYDRFMTQMSETGARFYKIGLAYECQLVDKVPYETHDISLDIIVTENYIYGRET